jgi:acylglycerol lipase
MPAAESRSRRRALLGLGGTAALAACQPLVQRSGTRLAAQSGPRLEPETLVSWDGARLPLEAWPAQDGSGAPVEPWAVIVGLHGMNDYHAAFTLPGPYWASRGVTTYAYDQRGFGAAPERGVWGGEEAMREDLRTACALLRARHPGAVLAVVGESMGGAVAITAFASDTPPDADRLVLAAPAVWGWREQGPLNSTLLWAGAHVAPGSRITAPDWLARRIWASDNVQELRRMGLDRRMIFATRIDTIYGLVGLMQHAADEIGALHLPTLYQYGAHDEIIPKAASVRAARHLPRGDRTAYYKRGWHLLLRDTGRSLVLDDALAFIRDPRAALPSGAPPIGPTPERRA